MRIQKLFCAFVDFSYSRYCLVFNESKNLRNRFTEVCFRITVKKEKQTLKKKSVANFFLDFYVVFFSLLRDDEGDSWPVVLLQLLTRPLYGRQLLGQDNVELTLADSVAIKDDLFRLSSLVPLVKLHQQPVDHVLFVGVAKVKKYM